MTVWMKHETLPDQLIEVPEAAVTGHELSGWRVTDPPPPPPVEDDETDDEETTSGEVVGESEQPDPAGSRRSTASTKKNKE